MRRVTLLVVVLLFSVLVPAVSATPGAAATRNEKTYSYGSDPQQKVGAFWYTGGKPRPALLILHGGYWYGGSRTDWYGQARWFADNGFQVFSADYRFNAQAAWPAQRDDALAVLA